MSFFKNLFSGNRKKSPAEMDNTEILQAIDALKLDREMSEILIEPENLSLLLLHFGESEKQINARWEKKARPGEILLEIIEREPNPNKLLAILAESSEEPKHGFVPPAERHFDEGEEGDVFFSNSEKGFSMMRIVKKCSIPLLKGETYSFTGQRVTAPCDDQFMSVGVSLSEYYPTEAEARKAFETNTVDWKVLMVPMRSGGIRATEREKIGRMEITPDLVELYEDWKEKFLAKEAGSF